MDTVQGVKWLLNGFCLLVALAAAPAAWAAGQSPTPAIKGYDTVAYFKLGKADTNIGRLFGRMRRNRMHHRHRKRHEKRDKAGHADQYLTFKCNRRLG